jgi:hypothetical protein
MIVEEVCAVPFVVCFMSYLPILQDTNHFIVATYYLAVATYYLAMAS